MTTNSAQANGETLSRVQHWMQEAILDPGLSDAAAVEEMLTRSRTLTASQRLAVYQNAYFARLLECLTAEFPATAKVLGEDAFTTMAMEYLRQHPSRSFTLARLGDHFPGFLEAHRPARENPGREVLDFADLVIELSQLERLYAEVFDAEGPERHTTSGMLPMAIEAWEGSRLRPFPCVRQLRLQFPVHELCSAVRRGEELTIPAPRVVHLVVSRRDYVVRRLEMTEQQAGLLARLLAGMTVGEAVQQTILACEAVGESLAPDVLRDWFRQWWLLPVFSASAAG